MKPLKTVKGWKRLGLGVAALCLFGALFCLANPASAQVTVPVLVDYFDTGCFNATEPQGITRIGSRYAIVDRAADAVFIVEQEGDLVRQFDISGDGVEDATGIAWNPVARVFAITDFIDDEIYFYNNQGSLQSRCDTQNFNSFSPQGITYISGGIFSGNYAVVDNQTRAIFIVNSDCILQNSSIISTFSSNPVGITYDAAADEFAIADTNFQEVFTTNLFGVLQDQFDTGFIGNGPRGLVLNPATNGYAIPDINADEVFTFNAEGTISGQFGTVVFGSDNPTGMTFIPTGPRAGNFAITDATDREVYFVNSAGILQDSCDTSLYSTNPLGIAFMPDPGTLAIIDNTADAIFIVDTNCILLERFGILTFGINSGSSHGITSVTDGGRLAFTDFTNDAVRYFSPTCCGRMKGSYSTSVFNGASPTGIAEITPTGNFVIVDNQADEAFITDPAGVLLARFDTASTFSSNQPFGVAFNSDNNTFAVLDNTSNQVTILDLPALLIPQDPPLCVGDFDGDGDVDGTDLAKFAAEFGRTDCPLCR